MGFYIIRKFFAIIAFFLLVASPVGAEPMTKEQGDAIIKELKQIRNELQEIKKGSLRGPRKRAARPTTAKVETKDSPSLGDPEAPITLVEFTDYLCPFCRRFYTNTLSKIRKQYVDTGKVRFVLRDLPLGFHANARPPGRQSRPLRARAGKILEDA
jgi:protein-disulfide isomerase